MKTAMVNVCSPHPTGIGTLQGRYYVLAETDAHRLYKEGKLDFDITNSEGKTRSYYICSNRRYHTEIKQIAIGG